MPFVIECIPGKIVILPEESRHVAVTIEGHTTNIEIVPCAFDEQVVEVERPSAIVNGVAEFIIKGKAIRCDVRDLLCHWRKDLQLQDYCDEREDGNHRPQSPVTERCLTRPMNPAPQQPLTRAAADSSPRKKRAARRGLSPRPLGPGNRGKDCATLARRNRSGPIENRLRKVRNGPAQEGGPNGKANALEEKYRQTMHGQE